MKLNVFPKTFWFLPILSSYSFNKKTLLISLNYNLKQTNYFIFYLKNSPINLILSLINGLEFYIIRRKNNFLFFFILKYMMYFFLFKKKYFYSAHFNNLIYWRSNLNKFNRLDFIFILNYIFNVGFYCITKYFLKIFNFLSYFFCKRLPGRRLYKKRLRWMSYFFFKKLSRQINVNTKQSQKTIFSVMYWMFISKVYFFKTKQNTQPGWIFYKKLNYNFFNYNCFENIFLSELRRNPVNNVFKNNLAIWQLKFILPYWSASTSDVFWFLKNKSFSLYIYSNFFYKSFWINKILLTVVYLNFFFRINLFGIEDSQSIVEYDEIMETYLLMNIFDETFPEETETPLIYSFSEDESDDELNNNITEEIYENLDEDPCIVLDEEADVDSFESYSITCNLIDSSLFDELREYFFDWKRNFTQTNYNLEFVASRLQFFVKNPLSLNLFLIFYLISYPLFLNKIHFILANFLKDVYSSFLKTNYLNFYLYYNNIYPLFLLPQSIITCFKKKQENIIDEELSLFFRHHLGGFLEFFTNKKIFLRIVTRLKINKEIYLLIKKISQNHMTFQKMVGRGFFLDEMIFILWQSFYQKDIDFLVTWFQRTMTKIEFTKHKNFLKVFKFILIKYAFFFCSTANILGFRFDIRGKVGVSGNAKKRNTAFSFGSTGFSKKKHKLELRQGLVNTETGILGVTFILAF